MRRVTTARRTSATRIIFWDCPGTADARSAAVSSLDARGLSPREVGSWFWDRGLCPRSCFPPLPRKGDSGSWRVRYGQVDMISGVVYADGACTRFWFWPEAARAGWGFARLEKGRIDVLTYGALPGPVQTSPRSELYAFLQVLQITVLPLTVYSDYKGLIKGLALGPLWCCHPRRPNIDLWELIWKKVRDLGGLGETLVVRHARAHQRGNDMHVKGNRWADVTATLGRDLHS
eukprot:8634809-Pyramimonas_sp.AAC.1